jgi:hypothetical protein
MDSFALSGRTFAVRQSFAPIPSNDPALAPPCDEGSQPLIGDVRLAGALDHEPSQRPQCRGTVTASVYDGVCWRRLDLKSLTCVVRFERPEEFHALMKLLAWIVKESSGRLCTPALDTEGRLMGYRVTEKPKVESGRRERARNN